jgi:tRNA pseudouridine32 synthase / 23S rRNA pseudouridine746 synthase
VKHPLRAIPPEASTLRLPAGPWASVLDGLCAQFPAIGREQWLDRFARGRVLDEHGAPLPPDALYRAHASVHYFREVADETEIPFTETVLHVDEHLVVADKPHFLPVMPSGRFVEQTLLRRLMRRLGNPHLAPLHRIDRNTAGLVLFSANPATRAHYQALFRERHIDKRYLAVAPRINKLPAVYRSRLARGEPFFRMREVEGPPNAETQIEMLCSDGELAGYALQPITGRKHQLRVQMAALGAPIVNDPLYPQLRPVAEDDFRCPLQLLADSLAFADPISGEVREFRSGISLQNWPQVGRPNPP